MWGSLNKPGAHGENVGNGRDLQRQTSGGELTAAQRGEAEQQAVEFLKKVVRVPGVRISRDDFLRARSTPAGQAALAELRVDELRFVDMAQSVRWFGTEERVI